MVIWLTETLALLCGFIDVDFSRDDGPKLDKEMVEICVTKVLRGRSRGREERAVGRRYRGERQRQRGMAFNCCCAAASPAASGR